ncbi:hypothetical protein BD324DRAFT_580734 [Kockovaella imperatae]|uniref:tRNA-splicing endonuclease subunit Sen34 n=1 Tax=Kockovaella imperatae TaxID=4999 RepID=A0A1Y1UFL1_9TREE|nr:hypothetical protein BD324DRAFT_580734 [Kockovaella imperatae]ORX36296.1 hypothetical protein BD324DRAFT_580734 [Kockovaella imperatae]
MSEDGHASSSPGPSQGDSKLSIYLVNGVGTVWEAQTAAILHCTYGISGLRAGTLPGVSQQNVFLGLPVTLTKEETAWCVINGIAQLVPLHSDLPDPSLSDISSNTQHRIDRIQSYLLRQSQDSARKASIAREAYEKGGEKARLKREARAKAKAEKERDTNRRPAEASSSQQISPTDPPKMQSHSKSNPIYPHEVPSHPLFPDLTFAKPITRLPHRLFPFPLTARDRALLDTFKALHDRGYRIGLGPRFGGEYLVYPGDYLRYHAHFTTQVLVRDECIRPMELVAWGRLGTGTKKAGLLCCWDDERGDEEEREADEREQRAKALVKLEGRDEQEEDQHEAGPLEYQVEFYSLEWANFG